MPGTLGEPGSKASSVEKITDKNQTLQIYAFTVLCP
jgi:hypothetical protein